VIWSEKDLHPGKTHPEFELGMAKHRRDEQSASLPGAPVQMPCNRREQARPVLQRLSPALIERGNSDLPAGSSAATRIPTSATTTRVRLGARFIHLEVTALEIPGIQFLDGLETFFSIAHFDESESSGTAGKLVYDHFRRIYFPVGFEQALKVALVAIERQVADIDVDAHFFLLWRIALARISGVRL